MKKTKRNTVIGIAALFSTIALCLLFISIDDDSHKQIASIKQDANKTDKSIKIVTSQQTAHTIFETPTTSQLGTDIDGALNVDKDGNFIVDQDAWQLFEYLLIDRTSMNEEDLYAGIAGYIKSQLKEPALSQALQFLDDYKSYFNQLRFQSLALQELSWEQKLTTLNNIRNETFGEKVSQQLFGNENLQNQMALAKLRGEDITDFPLGKYMKHQLAEKNKRNHVEQSIKELRKQGVDEGQVWQTRAESYGTEAADRWQALDKKREKLAEQTAAFEKAKSQLNIDTNNPEKMEQLVKQHFTGSEQRRMLIKHRLNNSYH